MEGNSASQSGEQQEATSGLDASLEAFSESVVAGTREFVRANPALAITALAFFSVIIKVSRVTLLDSNTALALLQAAGPANVIIGAIAVDITILVLTAALLAAAIIIRGRRPGMPVSAGATSVLIGAAFASAFLLPWLSAVVIVVVTGLLLLSRGPQKTRSLATTAALSVAPVLLLTWVASSRPWFPAERLTIESRGDITAYVISEHATDLVVLTDRPRAVIRVESGKVLARSLCRVRDTKGYYPSVWSLIFERKKVPDMPRCP